MARTRLVVLAAFALVFALAACGGGTSRLTKEQYGAKVSHLCLLAADQFREMHLFNTMGEWQHNATKIVRIRVRFNKALAALKPPPSIKTDAAGFLGANENALADDRIAIDTARAGDLSGFYHALRADHGDHRSAYRAAEAIGATGCYLP